MVIASKNNFERRLGLWPAGFDAEGTLYATSTFGDYPHYLPSGPADPLRSQFTGWMLLNYQRPVRVSSTLGGYAPNYAVDENIKTYWSAATANPGECLQTDLGGGSTVRAIQINYADQDAGYLGKKPGLYHQYRILSSLDGKRWKVLVDKSRNRTDVPHDYIELPRPTKPAISSWRTYTYPPANSPSAACGFSASVAAPGHEPYKASWFCVLKKTNVAPG